MKTLVISLLILLKINCTTGVSKANNYKYRIDYTDGRREDFDKTNEIQYLDGGRIRYYSAFDNEYKIRSGTYTIIELN